MSFRVPEKFRVRTGRIASDETFGNNGAFELTLRTPGKPRLFAIASDQAGWEHVSVSRKDRCPTWDEMCAVKDLFCPHLWKPAGGSLLLPPSILVGVR